MNVRLAIKKKNKLPIEIPKQNSKKSIAYTLLENMHYSNK